MNATYLGGSVYAEWEDGMLLLTTNNGYPDDPRNKIYLEEQVIEALVAFIDRSKLSDDDLPF